VSDGAPRSCTWPVFCPCRPAPLVLVTVNTIGFLLKNGDVDIY
jgi:hypothetical protein